MTAIVTGAEQGLGLAIADLLTENGYHVINIPRKILYPYNPGAITDFILSVDLSDVKILINNFGINHLSWIGRTLKRDSDILLTNVMAPYWIINILMCMKLKNIRVINVASQTYKVPQRCTSLYCASKAALVQMTKVMARELADSGWIINAVAPGKMWDTEMSVKTDAQVLGLRQWSARDAEEYALKNIPIGRFTDTKEIAKSIFTILQMPDYMTGTCIDLTGGV